MERVVGSTLLGRPGAGCLHPPSLYMAPIRVVGLTALVLEGLFGGCRPTLWVQCGRNQAYVV